MSKRDRSTTALRPAQRDVPTRPRRTVVHWFTWRHLRCKVTETPNFLTRGWTQLELEAIAARNTPNPITATGYLAHGIDARELADAGGAVAFFTAWLNRAANGKAYQQAQYRWRQGDLLDPLALENDREA